jgi:hypothetical protein
LSKAFWGSSSFFPPKLNMLRSLGEEFNLFK